jgi:NAD(P)-dependent dehydrogenase (short-subunit alcohol dehydrogenase family)
MEKIFENKVALITGGAFGIGRATALAMSAMGAKVVVADWIDDQTTVNEIKKSGGKASATKCDVSKQDQVRAAIEHTITTYGRLDFGINDAGIEGESASTHLCTEENWDRTIGINLKGVWLSMKYQIDQMLKNGGGSIVNVASVAGLVGFVGLPAYVASKHAIVGLTKTAALEYAKQNIRVNAVCPGVIRTAMIDRVTGKDKAVEKVFENMEPIGRFGQPEEVAQAIVWLCSNNASFVTGSNITVDGGWTAA